MDAKSCLTTPVVFTQRQAGLSGANTGQHSAPAESEMYSTGTAAPNLSHRASSLSERNVQPVPVAPALTDYRPAKPVDLTFYETCQMLVHRYLHRPLPGKTAEPFAITRPIHGAMHGTRSAMWIPVLLSWRRQAGDTEALAFPDRLIADVMKAALLHDSGREGEGLDTEAWEQTSGIQCENHLLAMGCPATLAAQCKRGIINKDGRLDASKTLIEKLIHDADCLEIMRVSNIRQFDMQKLDLFRDFRSDRHRVEQIYFLAQQVRKVIASQDDLQGNPRIINSETQFQESTGQQVEGTRSKNKKTQFEFADNALLVQVQHLKKTAPELYKLYQQSAGSPPEAVDLNPLVMTKTANARGSSAGSGFTGQYVDQHENQKCKTYYIKEPKLPDAARNEVLMANLAKVLGLKVPCVHLVRKAGRTFVVSEWMEGLIKPDSKAFKKVDPKRLAHLYLVAAVLGNVNIIGAASDNTLFDPQGEMVPLDWGEAGEFGDPGASERKVGTFSGTVYELDTLLNPEYPHVKDTIGDSVPEAFQQAANIFQSLDKEAIHLAVRDLLKRDTGEITRLVEILGPDTPIDRQRLGRTIQERLAYLARRFPECCEQRITDLEQAAIVAGGVDGYSLPVSGKDIDRADLRLYHCFDKNGEPVTECWVKLTTAAARKLADQLGLPPRHHRALEDLDTYCSALCKSTEMSPFWRINLQHMLKICAELIVETEQNQARDPGYPRPEDRRIVEQTLECLNGLKAGISEAAKLQEGEVIRIDNLNKLLQMLPKELPGRLPVRVTSHAYEKIAKSSLPVRDIFHVRAWETGAENRIPNTHHWKLWPNVIFEYQPSIEHKTSIDNKPPIEIDWFSDDQLENVAMEGVIRLRQKGLGQEVSMNLVNALTQLGVDTTRPDSAAMQAQYIDALINCYQLDIPMAVELADEQDLSGSADQRQESKKRWLCKQLNWETVPCWETHHQIRSGRCVFYRPKDTDNSFASRPKIHPIHNLEFSGHQSRENILKQIFDSGGSLYSLVERIRLGLKKAEFKTFQEKDLKTGGANSVFYRLSDSQQSLNNHFKLVLDKAVLRRTDVQNCNFNPYGSSCDAVRRLHRNKRPCPDTWAANAAKRNNETIMPFLNLDEVEKVRVPASIESKLSHALFYHLGHWPDGRALAHVMEYSEEYSVQQLMKGPVSEIVEMAEAIGKSGELVELNPRIHLGIIDSLAGIKFVSGQFSNVDFSKIDLKNTVFEGVINFHNCHFDLRQFETIKFRADHGDSMQFYDCTLQGDNVEFGRISELKFFFNPEIENSRISQTQHMIFNILVSHFNYNQENADTDDIAVNLLDSLDQFGVLNCVDLTEEIDGICMAAAHYVGEVWDSFESTIFYHRFNNNVKRRVYEAVRRLVEINNDAKIIIPLISYLSIDKFLMNNKKILMNKISPDKISLRGVKFMPDNDFEGIDLARYDFISKRQPTFENTPDQLSEQILDDESRIDIVGQLCSLASMRNIDEKQIIELILNISGVNQGRILGKVLSNEIKAGNYNGVKILVALGADMTDAGPISNPLSDELAGSSARDANLKAITQSMQEAMPDAGMVKDTLINYCAEAICLASKKHTASNVTTLIAALNKMGAEKEKRVACYKKGLLEASEIGRTDIVEIIIAALKETGAKLEQQIECYVQSILQASKSKNTDTVKMLTTALEETETEKDKRIDCYKEVMIRVSQYSQDLETVNFLKATLEKMGVTIEKLIEYYGQQLFSAIKNNDTNRSRCLIAFLKKSGATLDLLDNNGETPLVYAIRCWKNLNRYSVRDHYDGYPGCFEYPDHHEFSGHHRYLGHQRYRGFHRNNPIQLRNIVDIIIALVNNGANHQDKDGHELIPVDILEKHQKFFKEFVS